MIRNAMVNVGKVAAASMMTGVINADNSSNGTISSSEQTNIPVNSVDSSSYTQIDLSKYPSLEHHMLHSSFRGDGKLEDYRLFLNDKLSSLIAISRFGNKGELRMLSRKKKDSF